MRLDHLLSKETMHEAESRVRSFIRNKNHDKQRVILLFNFECPFEGIPVDMGV